MISSSGLFGFSSRLIGLVGLRGLKPATHGLGIPLSPPTRLHQRLSRAQNQAQNPQKSQKIAGHPQALLSNRCQMLLKNAFILGSHQALVELRSRNHAAS